MVLYIDSTANESPFHCTESSDVWNVWNRLLYEFGLRQTLQMCVKENLTRLLTLMIYFTSNTFHVMEAPVLHETEINAGLVFETTSVSHPRQKRDVTTSASSSISWHSTSFHTHTARVKLSDLFLGWTDFDVITGRWDKVQDTWGKTQTSGRNWEFGIKGFIRQNWNEVINLKDI